MNTFTLLYAEDDNESRENYALVLKKYFKHVFLADNGKDALDIYHDKKPDMILIDIAMPCLTGLETIEIIRKKDKSIPVVFLSAYSEKTKLLHALTLKPEIYLIKPVKTSLLKNTLLKIMSELKNLKIVQIKKNLFWDKTHSSLLYKTEAIKLTQKEKSLMSILGNKANQYYSNDSIILYVWHDEIPDNTHNNKLVQLIYRLNKKIHSYVLDEKIFIENCYSLGYKLNITLKI